ncbi:hypothetical protein Syun_011951 [Stephania yunnanensis]|uniref:Uncharacterized protein n=1 Tax=Stephania yunnanensis TaxID=152371 RepID=A0AAP0JYH8_9MAGN
MVSFHGRLGIVVTWLCSASRRLVSLGAYLASRGLLKNLQTIAMYTSLLSGPIPKRLQSVSNCGTVSRIEFNIGFDTEANWRAEEASE